MSPDVVAELLRQLMKEAMILTAPVLIAAVVLGFGLTLLQTRAFQFSLMKPVADREFDSERCRLPHGGEDGGGAESCDWKQPCSGNR
jgi:hypothetical protein